MKSIAVVLIIVVIFTGFSCRRGDKTKAVIEETAAERLQLPEKVKVVIDLRNIREGIVAYETAHGAFPAALAEIDLELNCPDEYDYDSSSGIVKSKSYPDL